MKKFLIILLSLTLTGCWKDHFKVSHRLPDKALAEFKELEGFTSQFNYLNENDHFVIDDFYSPSFAKIRQKQRIDIFLRLNPNFHPEDKIILKEGEFRKYCSKEWILALFGPPLSRDKLAGMEFWEYRDQSFSFQNNKMIDRTPH